MSINEWVARHNRWSNAEADEFFSENENDNLLKADILGESRNRIRYYKGFYYKAPLFFRAGGYFFYRYIFKLGFLDGRVGFIYAFLQALWFRMLVDIKIDEIKRTRI